MESAVYEDAGVTVYDVSTDDVDSHREFAADRGIEYDLLADPDGGLCEAFGVERGRPGRTERTTFVRADCGVIRTYEDVSPDGHARVVLMDLHALSVVEGCDLVVVGRSPVIGRPLANRLLQDAMPGNATVTVCHTRTADLGPRPGAPTCS